MHIFWKHKKKIIYLSKAEYAFVERNSERGYLIWFLATTQTLDFFFLWSFWIYPELGRDRFANAPWKSGSIKVSAFDTKADKSFIIERVYIDAMRAKHLQHRDAIFTHPIFT